jgi:hypothetical protein
MKNPILFFCTKLNVKDPSKLLTKKNITCCQKDESCRFQLDPNLSYYQAVVTIKS